MKFRSFLVIFLDMAYNIQELLSEMVKRGASDLHITAGSPPLLRISGKLTPIGADKLKPDETMRMTYSLMNEMQKKTFEQQKECDFSFGIANLPAYHSAGHSHLQGLGTPENPGRVHHPSFGPGAGDRCYRFR